MDIANSGEFGDVRTGDRPGPPSSFVVGLDSTLDVDDDDVGEDGSELGEVRVIATVTGELCSSGPTSLLLIINLSVVVEVSTDKNALFLLLLRGGDGGPPLLCKLSLLDEELINSLYPSLVVLFLLLEVPPLPLPLIFWPLVSLLFFFFFLCFFGKSTRSRLFGSLILPMV